MKKIWVILLLFANLAFFVEALDGEYQGAYFTNFQGKSFTQNQLPEVIIVGADLDEGTKPDKAILVVTDKTTGRIWAIDGHWTDDLSERTAVHYYDRYADTPKIGFEIPIDPNQFEAGAYEVLLYVTFYYGTDMRQIFHFNVSMASSDIQSTASPGIPQNEGVILTDQAQAIVGTLSELGAAESQEPEKKSFFGKIKAFISRIFTPKKGPVKAPSMGEDASQEEPSKKSPSFTIAVKPEFFNAYANDEVFDEVLDEQYELPEITFSIAHEQVFTEADWPGFVTIHASTASKNGLRRLEYAV